MRVGVATGCLSIFLGAVAAVAQNKLDPARETLGQTGKIPVLVISGNDSFHRWKETTPLFRPMLEAGGRLDTRRVLATARLPKAERDAPAAFVHTPGKGRVFFTPLGHSKASHDDPGFRQLLVRAVEWAATGDVVDSVNK